MRRPSRTGMSCLLVLITGIPLAAQNLHAVGREKPFTVSGGAAVNQIFNAAHGVSARRSPYSLFASGNLTLGVYGWTLPVTFTYSNRKTAFTQPFNQLGLHPTWKWITAHAGYTSMSFSPYTVNGHIFSGAGVDLAPEGKWKFSALYGRFARAAEADSTGRPPTFQRTGYGAKVSYGAGGNFVDVIVFSAADDMNSIRPLTDSAAVAPRKNFVISVGGGRTIAKHWLLKTELASSALTRDARAAPMDGHRHILARTKIFFHPRQSSAYYHAFRSSLDYHYESWVAGFSYERVDPGYETLGAYYFNNDLENITFNLSTTAVSGKLTFAGSCGMQRDNLAQTKVSSMRRMVGAANINYAPSPRSSLSASFSGFRTFTNIRPAFASMNELSPFDHLDTLNFTQITKNASITATTTLPGSDRRRESLHMNLNWQQAADKQGQTEQPAGNAFCNLVAGYAVTFPAREMTMALTFNASINKGRALATVMIGPHASIARTFLQRRLRTTLTTSWNHLRRNGMDIGKLTSVRLHGTWSVTNRHNISVSVVTIKRSAASESSPGAFSEFTGTAGYSYRFAGGGKDGRKTGNQRNGPEP